MNKEMATRHIGIIIHGIGRPGRALEPGEAPFWISKDQFDALLGMIAEAAQADLIRLSFDDGNASDHEIALPRLLALGLTADFFPLSGRINEQGSLNAEQIRALETAGMGIGSHGIAHRDWRRLSLPELREELARSRSALEAICEAPVTEAAIPFGSYNARVLRELRRAGYRVAYSSDKGRMNPRAFLRPRSSVRSDMRDKDFAELLDGRLSLTRRLRRGIGMVTRQMPGMR